MTNPVAALPYAYGGPVSRAVMRQEPDDFVVEEDLGFEPDGEGEHLFLYVCKVGLTTRDAARRIARSAGVRESDVGYAGLKDRHARTSQWFSVYLPGRDAPDRAAFEGDELRLLRLGRHGRKLRRAQHRGNRFRLRLRACNCDEGVLRQRLEHIAGAGVPNYFGEQRFGNAGDNVEQARLLFRGEIRRRRQVRGLLLSAARSYLFNEVVAERVRRGNWARRLDGDVLLDCEGRLFRMEQSRQSLDAEVARGTAQLSAMLWGTGELLSRAEPREIEQSVAAAHPELTAGLEAAGLKQQRRASCLQARDLEWSYEGSDLALQFSLPVGSYATSLIREVVDTGQDTRDSAC